MFSFSTIAHYFILFTQTLAPVALMTLAPHMCDLSQE